MLCGVAETFKTEPVLAAKMAEGFVSPMLIYTVSQISLIQKCRNALIPPARNHQAIRFAIHKRVARIEELLADQRSCLLNLHPSKRPVYHPPLIEADLVGNLLGLKQLSFIFGRVYFQAFDQHWADFIAVFRSVNDWQDVLTHPLRIDPIELGFFSQLKHHDIVVWTV